MKGGNSNTKKERRGIWMEWIGMENETGQKVIIIVIIISDCLM